MNAWHISAPRSIGGAVLLGGIITAIRAAANGFHDSRFNPSPPVRKSNRDRRAPRPSIAGPPGRAPGSFPERPAATPRPRRVVDQECGPEDVRGCLRKEPSMRPSRRRQGPPIPRHPKSITALIRPFSASSFVSRGLRGSRQACAPLTDAEGRLRRCGHCVSVYDGAQGGDGSARPLVSPCNRHAVEGVVLARRRPVRAIHWLQAAMNVAKSVAAWPRPAIFFAGRGFAVEPAID